LAGGCELPALTIGVSLGRRSYPVHIGAGLLRALGREVKPLARGLTVIVTAAPVRRLYGMAAEESLRAEGVHAEVLEVPDGEAAKTCEAFAAVVEGLLGMNAGRDALILSLGGGCVGDLAGFVASVYKRGTALVHVPTTLLAQVDSSIGGKTAINHPRAKNLLGTIYQPRLVLADTGLLRTLPPKEVGCGMAELIKYGAILHAPLLDLLEAEKEAILRLSGGLMEEVIATAVRLKAEVVERDELDDGSVSGSRSRIMLNFGHTVGHAIEASMAYREYSHGEAVAIGMVAEAKLSSALGLMSPAEAERLEELISSYGLPTRLSGDAVTPEALLSLMIHDKKAESGRMRLPLPKRLGEGTVVSPAEGAVVSAIEEVLED